MQKIISLFKRNYEGNRHVYNEVVEGAEWVIRGEGTATRKLDGTSCLIKDGVLYKRYDVKKDRKPPEGFIPAQDKDTTTGHWPGWIKVGEGPEDKWHREGFEESIYEFVTEQTYELIGPKINGNPEKVKGTHELIEHGTLKLGFNGRDFESIKEYLRDVDIEGIVWHHSDGRMVKIKKKDFGFKR